MKNVFNEVSGRMTQICDVMDPEPVPASSGTAPTWTFLDARLRPQSRYEILSTLNQTEPIVLGFARDENELCHWSRRVAILEFGPHAIALQSQFRTAPAFAMHNEEGKPFTPIFDITLPARQ